MSFKIFYAKYSNLMIFYKITSTHFHEEQLTHILKAHSGNVLE